MCMGACVSLSMSLELTYSQNSWAALLVCRLIIGIAEAGVIPCVAFYMSFFYGRHEVSPTCTSILLTYRLASDTGSLSAQLLWRPHSPALWRTVLCRSRKLLLLRGGCCLSSVSSGSQLITDELRRCTDASCGPLGPLLSTECS
jgi:MFS family permease